MRTTLMMSFEQIRHRWGWFLVLGIILIVLGLFALVYIPAATLASVLVLAWLMIASGIIEGIYAFHARRWIGVLVNILWAVLSIFAGLLVVTHPLAGTLALTLLFAMYFTVIGLFRIIAAIYLKYRSWGWSVFDGIVSFVLGTLIWAEWPSTAIWFLGLALGATLVLRGWAMVAFAFAVHALPQPALTIESAGNV